MKTASADYITKEQASKRRPAEIYKVWTSQNTEYYTSSDLTITYDGNDYVPIMVKRDSAQFDADLNVSSINVVFDNAQDPLIDYIAQNPVDIVWIEISRIFLDQSPYEKSVVFIGQIRDVQVKGAIIQCNCVGFEFYLKHPAPSLRYQPQCNWTLFNSKCTLVAASYKSELASITLSADGLTITHATIGGQSDGYWKFGKIVFEGYERMVVSHSGTSIEIRFPILSLEDGDTIDLYPGCDLAIGTCYSKYNNLLNFGGFPYIPLDNPATWIP